MRLRPRQVSAKAERKVIGPLTPSSPPMQGCQSLRIIFLQFQWWVGIHVRERVWTNISQAFVEGIKAVLLSASIFF